LPARAQAVLEPGDGCRVVVQLELLTARGIGNRFAPERDERHGCVARRQVGRDDPDPIGDVLERRREFHVGAVHALEDRIRDVEDEDHRGWILCRLGGDRARPADEHAEGDAQDQRQECGPRS
jgi:hypothetical protein